MSRARLPSRPVSPAPSFRLQPPSIFAYLDAVAHHGSIRKAADALHVASSALNKRILDLEAELGTQLFERLPRGVRATAAGELFLAYVQRRRCARARAPGRASRRSALRPARR